MRRLAGTCGLLLLLAAPALAQPGPAIEESEAVTKWVKARMAAASKGAPELVRVPLAYHSMGWGCSCPEVYIGTQTNSQEGPWISVKLAPGLKGPPQLTRPGVVVVAEGTFTGQRVEERGDESVKYQLAEFQMLRWRNYHEGDTSPDRKLYLVLSAKELKEKIEPLRDDRPWIVVVESYPRADKRAGERAEKLRQALAGAGFAQAEVLDSRRAARLFCCYLVVAAGRYKTKPEALAAAKAVRQKKYKDVTVRQGW